MGIREIIIGWLVIMTGILLWQKFRDDRRYHRKYWDFGPINLLVYSSVFFGLIWAISSRADYQLSFSSADEQIRYGERTNQLWLITKGLWSKIAQYPDSLDLHYQLIQHHFIQENPANKPADVRYYNMEGTRIFSYYSSLTESGNSPAKNDMGNLFLAIWYMERPGHDYDNASFHLRRIKNGSMKFVNYVAGKALLYGIGTTAAYPYFKAELENNGYKEGAWEGLSYVYKETGNDSALRALIENRESRNAVPYDIRSEYFFRNGDWISYYGMRFSGMFDTLPLWGFVGALAITFIWLLYLYRLNFIGTIRISGMLLTVCIGVLLTMTSWSIYGFYKYVLHFGITGNMMNDFLYCIFGIGFIEELVKLIPFLIILYFTKIISRPVDYLIIASCSGLGFALFENLLYISSYGLDVIHSRALTASVAHMFSSVVLAYGFILQRFRYPDKKWIIPLFFFLASLAHGFYDFWLLSPAVKNLAVITLLFFLSEITVLSVLFNAGLNQSVPANTPSSALAINTKLLAGNIAGVFVLLFALEYVAITFVYGTFYANHTLTNSFLSGGYLVFFISLRLSSIDIVPGEWPRLDFLRSFLPSGLFGGFRRNHNAAVGLTLIFKPGDATSALSPHLPFTGKVIRRLKLKEENRWFEIQLSKPVQFNFIDISTVFVLPAESNGVLAQNEETPVKVFRLSEDPETGKKKLIYLDDVVAG